METVNISNLSGSAAATTAISLGVNLPSTAAVADSFSVTAQVFDSLGNAHDMDVTFTKTAVNTWSWAASDATLDGRSEEHTSELQSLMRTSYAVFCLNNKKKTIYKPKTLVTHT